MKSKSTKSVKKNAPATTRKNAVAKPAKAVRPAKAHALPPAPPLLKIVCAALDDKKAGEVRILCVAEQSSITDFLVIATGTSEPHLRALRVELEKVIDASGTRIVGMDTGEAGSGWLVIDAFDVMIHVLTQETRERYSLENLWKDAKEIALHEILGQPKPAPIASVVAKSKKAAAPAKKAAPVKKAPAKKPAKAGKK